ncbi:SDR family NAD(P)-dependent oxidoreductase [Acidocella sp.]|uniref:SDR family NAD(P)-dependent oxidoreductase n=1 Tax=Acidocella sp. TaxID=50710 RepID=UPI0026320A61|nr:3-oxoacyl-ACP reductase FabG [Acidocella sp.]
MDLGLKDKVAIVTGSGRGIGAVTARALAEEGAKIVITDINPDTTEATRGALAVEGYEVIGVPCDVRNKASVAAMVDKAVEAFGTVHILVNNAGFPRDNYITKMPEEDWDAVVEVILKGAYLCSAAVVPHMMKQQYGRIVNISSRAHFGNPGQTNYSAAKAGIIGFTRALGMEQGRFNVTVNAIAPGFIATEMIAALPHYEKIKQRALAMNTVPRLGTERDIANGVLFLVSEAAGYISGETLHITGGRYG